MRGAFVCIHSSGTRAKLVPSDRLHQLREPPLVETDEPAFGNRADERQRARSVVGIAPMTRDAAGVVQQPEQRDDNRVGAPHVLR